MKAKYGDPTGFACTRRRAPGSRGGPGPSSTKSPYRNPAVQLLGLAGRCGHLCSSSRPAAWTTPFYLGWTTSLSRAPGPPGPRHLPVEWQALINPLAGHPRRSEVRLTPIFTDYYAKCHCAAFWDDVGIVASYAGVETIGFELYDTGDST